MIDGDARVDRLRQEARALQRALAAANAGVARAAAARCAQLPRFAARGIDEILAARASVTRADLHDVVAFEAGFAGWAGLLADSLPDLARVTMYVDAMSAWLNRWFATYDEAAASRRRDGGILLPWRHQFVVVERECVAALGLDPKDPDWDRIGRDWVRPHDAEAHSRLARARWSAMLARGEELP